jgi:hypothetical protein
VYMGADEKLEATDEIARLQHETRLLLAEQEAKRSSSKQPTDQEVPLAVASY